MRKRIHNNAANVKGFALPSDAGIKPTQADLARMTPRRDDAQSGGLHRIPEDVDMHPAVRSERVALTSESYLERQAAIESNARSYPKRLPIVLKSGAGVIVKDVEGREYIDCLAGAGSLPLGHSHPVTVDAIRRALDDGVVLQTLDLPTPLKERFISELFDSLPAGFSKNYKIHFCGPSGADAVEAALKLVRVATGRKGVMAFRGAYHGMTQGALGVSGEIHPKLAACAGEGQFLPFPSDYRCPFGVGGAEGANLCADYIEGLLDDPNSGVSKPAGIILEALQGEGGVNPAPNDWLRRIGDITRRRGIPLIVDEVQTGLGRTGRLYAIEHAELTPDVLVLSKAIGGGLPLAVVIYRRELDVWKSGTHAGTFRGNQLAFASGAAAIRHIVDEHLECRAAELGERLQSALKVVAKSHSCIGHVRGRGLMVGAEIIDADAHIKTGRTPSPDRTRARAIQDECLNRGLIIELGGREGSVARFLPPLIVTDTQIDEIAGRFCEAVTTAEARHADSRAAIAQ